MTSGRDSVLRALIYEYDADGAVISRTPMCSPGRDPAIQANVDENDFEGAFVQEEGVSTTTASVVLDFIRPLTTPFPEPVARRLAEYNRQIQGLIDARQAYIRGVLDALGVDNTTNVSVDLDAYTYSYTNASVDAGA